MMDSKTTIKELRDRIENFSNPRGWGKCQNPKDLVMALSVEASELVEIFQWIPSDEASNISENSKEFEHLKEEVADVFWYLTNLCDHFNIDLTEAVVDKEEKNEKRFPRK